MIFSSRRSFLFKNRITEEFWNQGYVIIVLKSALLSSIRFWGKIKTNQKFRNELPVHDLAALLAQSIFHVLLRFKAELSGFICRGSTILNTCFH